MVHIGWNVAKVWFLDPEANNDDSVESRPFSVLC